MFCSSCCRLAELRTGLPRLELQRAHADNARREKGAVGKVAGDGTERRPKRVACVLPRFIDITPSFKRV